MRAVLALTIFLIGFGSAAPEPEYSSLIGDYFHISAGQGPPSLIQIESSTRRSDRLMVSSRQIQEPEQAAFDAEVHIPPLDSSALIADSEAAPQTEPSLDDLCNALFTSAEDNDLPVPFFANLLWQESRLRDDAVSPVGALGIAQFMPRVAMASGLDDPFDPLQAIPASARLLRQLRNQFGNLGFVAAAYNAGAHRVSEWLEHGRSLPRETLNYVVRVTGRSADEWRKTPPDDATLHFVRRLPCRVMPAFADLEQAQNQVELAHQVAQQDQAEQKPATPAKVPQSVVLAQAAPRRHQARQNIRYAADPHGRNSRRHEAQRARPSQDHYKSAERAHRGRVHRA